MHDNIGFNMRSKDTKIFLRSLLIPSKRKTVIVSKDFEISKVL